MKTTPKHIKMLEALAKVPGLRAVEDPVAVIDQHLGARFDSWQNEVTGLGTHRDKTTYSSFVQGRLLMDGELAALYHGDDLAARMVDVVPDEMFREGFAVETGDTKLDTELSDNIEAIGAVDKLADAKRWGRLFGSGGVLLGADDGRSAATPLVPERAKALTYLYVLDRRYLFPLTYYTESGHPKLGQAETYMVTSPSFNANVPVAVVHESRLVLFGGATTGIREREGNQGWDYSVLQRANDVLATFNMGWQAAAVLLADGNQAVFKMAGLSDSISGGQSEALQTRLRLMDQARSIVRAIVVDAGSPSDKMNPQPSEEFTRQVFPMTGIPDVLDKLMLRLAAAVQIPVTILMGQSPAGMNATGESDFRWFYDRIRSEQTRKLAPKLRRIIRVMMQTKSIGEGSQAIKIKFPPLWSETPQAKATTRKLLLEGDGLAILNGVLPEEATLSRFRPNGFEQELQLSPEAQKARESALADEIKRLEEGPPEPPEPETDDETDATAKPAFPPTKTTAPAPEE